MKPITRHSLLALALLGVPSANAAQLVPGKKLGVEYGPAASSTTNWNNFATNSTKAAGTVTLLNGDIADGVSITTIDGQFWNGDGPNNFKGLASMGGTLPPDFVDSVTTDIAGNFSLGDARPYKTQITGLNPYLKFTVYAVTAAAGSQIDTVSITGAATYGPSPILRSTSVNTPAFHTLTDVVPTLTGDLELSVTDTSASSNPIINGALFIATGPTTEGLADADSDGLPLWWETAYGLSDSDNGSTVADNGATGDPDGDGFDNLTEFKSGTNPRDATSFASSWVKAGDGAWSATANWTGAVPNAPGAGVYLGPEAQTTSPVIDLDIPVVVGNLRKDGAFDYTIQGANVLNLYVTTGSASLAADAGILTLATPVSLIAPTTISAGAGAEVRILGALDDGMAGNLLTKTGGGNLLLTGGVSGFTGGIALTAGTLTLDFAADAVIPGALSGGGSLIHKGGNTLTLTGTNTHSGAMTVNNGGTLALLGTDSFGTGPLNLNDATLHAMGEVAASGKAVNIGVDGAVVEVDDTFNLTTGWSLPGTGTVTKKGAGTWHVTGGNAGTMGLLTVEAGALDLARIDTFGNHTAAQQEIVLKAGTSLSNGTGATGYNTFKSVTLEGATVHVTNSLSALTGTFQAYTFKEKVTVTGFAPSLIIDDVNGAAGSINIGGTTNLGGAVGPDLVFDVADVTADAADDLVVDAKLKPSADGNYAALKNGIVKRGTGTLHLKRANTYTGDTKVEAGVLVLDQASLAVGANVRLATGATLQLDYSGSNNINQLIIDGQLQLNGTWGGMGSGADHETPLIVGGGILDVANGSSGNAFADWMLVKYPAIVAPNNAPDADPDHDGLTNLQEFAFGGNPGSGSNRGPGRHGIETVVDSNHLTITFACRNGATFAGTTTRTASRDGVDYTVRASTDLTNFTLDVSEVTAITTGLPGAPEGYTYRTFQVTDPVSAHPQAFIQVQAGTSP